MESTRIKGENPKEGKRMWEIAQRGEKGRRGDNKG